MPKQPRTIIAIDARGVADFRAQLDEQVAELLATRPEGRLIDASRLDWRKGTARSEDEAKQGILRAYDIILSVPLPEGEATNATGADLRSGIVPGANEGLESRNAA
jgi:hypothetical protein